MAKRKSDKSKIVLKYKNIFEKLAVDIVVDILSYVSNQTIMNDNLIHVVQYKYISKFFNVVVKNSHFGKLLTCCDFEHSKQNMKLVFLNLNYTSLNCLSLKDEWIPYIRQSSIRNLDMLFLDVTFSKLSNTTLDLSFLHHIRDLQIMFDLNDNYDESFLSLHSPKSLNIHLPVLLSEFSFHGQFNNIPFCITKIDGKPSLHTLNFSEPFRKILKNDEMWKNFCNNNFFTLTNLYFSHSDTYCFFEIIPKIALRMLHSLEHIFINFDIEDSNNYVIDLSWCPSKVNIYLICNKNSNVKITVQLTHEVYNKNSVTFLFDSAKIFLIKSIL